MNERRIERLTREIPGPELSPPTLRDDDGLEDIVRVVAIAILVLLVFTFAAWPREDDARARPVRTEQPAALPTTLSWGSLPEADTRLGALEYSPIY